MTKFYSNFWQLIQFPSHIMRVSRTSVCLPCGSRSSLRLFCDLWTFRPFVSSPPGCFAPKTFRPLDGSPPRCGRFAPWL